MNERFQIRVTYLNGSVRIWLINTIVVIENGFLRFDDQAERTIHIPVEVVAFYELQELNGTSLKVMHYGPDKKPIFYGM